MGLLQNGGLDWLEGAIRGTSSLIEEGQATVVGTSNEEIGVLGGEGHGAEWRCWVKCGLWDVGVDKVPDVGFLWHVWWLLLESELSVGGSDSVLTDFWVPGDLGDATLNFLWVLEDHDGLGVDWLRHVLWLLILEVLFKEINLIVLLDAAGSTLNQVLGGTSELEGWLLDELPHVLVHLIWLMWVVLLWPTSNVVVASLVVGGHTLSVNLIKRKDGGYKI